MSQSAPVTSEITWCAPSSLPVTTTPATRLKATGRSSSSVSDIIPSIRSSTRWAIDEGRPSQVGVATIRISASRSSPCSRGQWSVSSPMSVMMPGGTTWSTTRNDRTSTSRSRRPSATTSARTWVFDGSGLCLSVQFRITALMAGSSSFSVGSEFVAAVRPAKPRFHLSTRGSPWSEGRRRTQELDIGRRGGQAGRREVHRRTGARPDRTRQPSRTYRGPPRRTRGAGQGQARRHRRGKHRCRRSARRLWAGDRARGLGVAARARRARVGRGDDRRRRGAAGRRSGRAGGEEAVPPKRPDAVRRGGQRQGGHPGGQGGSEAMTTHEHDERTAVPSAEPGTEPGAAPTDEDLRTEAELTRQELAESVTALGAKGDVKGRVQAAAKQRAEVIQSGGDELVDKLPDPVAERGRPAWAPMSRRPAIPLGALAALIVALLIWLKIRKHCPATGRAARPSR